MAQQNFQAADGLAISAKAGTALTAGDFVYASGGTTASWGSTISEAVLKDGWTWDDVDVKDVKSGTASVGDRTIGLAAHDAVSGSQVTVITEGIFLSRMEGTTNITSGALLRPGYNTTTAGVAPVAAGSTAFIAANSAIIGRSLTGATDQGDYILWKLSV